MATPRIGGPGIGLTATSRQNNLWIPAGSTYIIPAGTYTLVTGMWTTLQYFDPNMNQWRSMAANQQQVPHMIDSDGGNFRLANLTGTPVAAVVSNSGSGYTNGIGTAQTGLTITPSAGGSTWVPVVGGAINSTVTITNGGSGYFFTPIVIASAPPPGGFPAMVSVTGLSGGAITAVVVQSGGAGYRTAPTLTVIPDPRDTNAGGAVLTVNPVLVGSGNLLAMYPSSNGRPLTTAPTFTFSPASTTAASNVIMNWAVTGLTVTGGGTGVPTGSTGISIPTQSLSPDAANTIGYFYVAGGTYARPAYYQLSLSGGVIQGGGNSFPVDNGHGFQTIPAFTLITPNGAAPATAPNITCTVGGVDDWTNYLQPI